MKVNSSILFRNSVKLVSTRKEREREKCNVHIKRRDNDVEEGRERYQIMFGS